MVQALPRVLQVKCFLRRAPGEAAGSALPWAVLKISKSWKKLQAELLSLCSKVGLSAWGQGSNSKRFSKIPPAHWQGDFSFALRADAAVNICRWTVKNC